MKKILVLDNYDSFTYNLVQLVIELGFGRPAVFRNDKITLSQVSEFDKVILSPGPGLPSEAGIMPALINQLSPKLSILGVCLGHQAIAEAFGAKLINLPEFFHGKSSKVTVLSETNLLFKGIPSTFEAGRYHSWAVEADSVPACLEVSAVGESGEIMALSHKERDCHGVQFHPESVLTPLGSQLIRNFLEN